MKISENIYIYLSKQKQISWLETGIEYNSLFEVVGRQQMLDACV